MVADGNGHCWNGVVSRQMFSLGRCYSQRVLFHFSSVMLIRTSSHTWGRWYLPMFLFRDGLLTLIYIDSLINLERPCSSLPTMLKLLIVVEWPLMLLWSYIGEGAFRCSLNLSPNVGIYVCGTNICSSQELLKQEQKQIQHALTLYKYPMWAIIRMKTKTSAPRNNRNNNLNDKPTCRNSITVPYNEGLSEAFKNICKRYGIEVHFKSGKTIKDELVAPKE